jgi:hypothetical protein
MTCFSLAAVGVCFDACALTRVLARALACAFRMGTPFLEVEIDIAMAQLDPQGNGRVSFDAFRIWYHKKHNEAGEHDAVLQLIESKILHAEAGSE